MSLDFLKRCGCGVAFSGGFITLCASRVGAIFDGAKKTSKNLPVFGVQSFVLPDSKIPRENIKKRLFEIPFQVFKFHHRCDPKTTGQYSGVCRNNRVGVKKTPKFCVFLGL